MKNPLLKYLFTCKSCGNESPCELTTYSKKELLKVHGKPNLDQRCLKCGYEANYHLDRLYARTKVWPMVMVWGLALTVSILVAVWRYEWSGDYFSDEDLGGVAFGFVVPLFAGMYVAVRMWRLGKNFNKAVRDIK